MTAPDVMAPVRQQSSTEGEAEATSGATVALGATAAVGVKLAVGDDDNNTPMGGGQRGGVYSLALSYYYFI